MHPRRLLYSAIVLLFTIHAVAQAPDLIWGRNFGGINVSGIARVTRSCITSDGGVVNAGYFLNQVDLDNDPGVVELFNTTGNTNGFVSGLSSAGLTQWALQFGSLGECHALDVDTDNDGNVYVAVKFDISLDADPGAGTSLLIAQGMGSQMRDVAIVKLDAQGQYLASRQFSDVEFQMEGVVVEINSLGQPVVAYIDDLGIISSYTLNPADLSTVSTFQFGNLGLGTGYLADMQLDAQDNQVYAGRFSEEFNFDPQDPFADTPAFGTGDDIFFAKISAAGQLIWGHALGSNNGDDGAYSVCTAPDGGVLVTGYFGGITDFDPGAANVSLASGGSPALFLMKMNANDTFAWVKQVSSTGEDRGFSVRTDTQGTIALTGFIGATCDVDPGPGTTSITATASSIIAWGFDPLGDFLWATRLAAGDYVNSPLRVEHFSDDALHLFGSCMGLELDRDPSATTDLLYTADGAAGINLKWGVCAPVVPTVAITADIDPVCPGVPVTFTAATTNGGLQPQYQWMVNGAPVGTNSATYAVTGLQLGDEVTCTLTSDADCADPNNAQSNAITVDCGSPLGVLFFSEYVEGSANNKALEIFNPTATAVDLADYAVALYANGSAAPTQTVQLTGFLASGEVYVIANASASAGVLAVADITSAVCTFNGDDAVALLYQGFASDVVGVIGVDPGAQWPIPTGGATAESTLRRLSTVVQPQPDWSIAQFQWDDFGLDDFSDLGNGFITGLDDLQQTAPLLMPNPTRDGFRIAHAASVRVRVLSASGTIVADHGLVAPTTLVPTDGLARGVYMVELTGNNVVRHARLMVQ